MVTLLLIVASATLVVVAAMNYQSSRQTLQAIESHLRGTIQAKGSDLVRSQSLALRDLVADNAFGDVGRLVDRTVDQDDQLVYGLFLGSDLKPWGFASRGAAAPSGPASPGSGGRLEGAQVGKQDGKRDWKELPGAPALPAVGTGIAIRSTAYRDQTAIEFSTAVVDDKGEALGSVRYAISDRGLREALSGARAASLRALLIAVALLLLLTLGTTSFGIVLARRAASRVTQPIRELTRAADELAKGNRDAKVAIASGDEIEVLGRAFNRMVDELRDNYARLEEMNHSLEQKVTDRTRELGVRNRDMRLVLDNVDQGFLTLSPDGRLAEERSAIVDRWFGPYDASATFSDYIARIDPVFGDFFALGYEALLDNFLPRALCLEQLPTRMQHQGREFRCNYLLLGQDAPVGGPTKGAFMGLLIVINDVTAELLAAQRDAERREILAIFEGLNRDRPGFLGFIDESDAQVKRLREADLDTQKRLLHTLKGNCNLMELKTMAELCHKVEEEIADSGELLSEVSLAKVAQRWREVTTALERFLGERGRDLVEVPASELGRLADDVRAARPSSQLLDRIASWSLEPADLPLSRLAHHAQSLASRLGKGDLAVVIDGGDVRLMPGPWRGLWSDLVHVIRNAVDHGIEAPSARQKAGKPARPQLRLAVTVVDRTLAVEIEDDGAGIDWSALRNAATRRGLPHGTEQELVRALFADGVTTRSEVTTVSGRGVGMAAVRQQVEQLGGEVTVISRQGAGTCFRFTFPLPGVGPRFGVLLPASAPAANHAVA